MKVGEKDLRILQAIEKYPYASDKVLAANLGMNYSTFSRRKSRLESDDVGILTKDKCRVNYAALRRFSLGYIFFEVRRGEKRAIQNAIDYLTGFDFVIEVGETSSRFDLLAKFISFDETDAIEKTHKLFDDDLFRDHWRITFIEKYSRRERLCILLE